MTDEHEDKSGQFYELGYHLVPSLGEDDLALRVEELQKKVASLGGSIQSEGAPQSFTLAYTMRRMRSGKWEKYDSSFFGWTRFSLPASKIPELKEELEHNEYLIRHLLIKLEKEALTPPKVRKPRPIELKEVETAPKALEHKHDVEKKGEISEQELDKQIEELIK